MDFKKIALEIYETNKSKGYWDEYRADGTYNLNKGERIMLICTELSEAMQADRKNKKCELDKEHKDKLLELFETHPNDALYIYDEHIKHTLEEEFADTIIRALDYMVGFNLDLDSLEHLQLKNIDYGKAEEFNFGEELLLTTKSFGEVYNSMFSDTEAMKWAIENVLTLASYLNIDIQYHIIAKVRYNMIDKNKKKY